MANGGWRMAERSDARPDNIATPRIVRLRSGRLDASINATTFREPIMRRRPILIVSFSLLILALSAAVTRAAQAQQTTPATAQPSPLKRTVLMQHALTIPGREAVVVAAELAAGGAAPRHTHPGEEFGYVLDGTVTIEIAGHPTLTLKPGDSFFIPPNTPHVARNTGAVPWKAISTYIVESGKPLASPAP